MRKTAAVTPEKYALGWYLYNIMASDCRHDLIGVVDRLVPCLHGGNIKPDRPWTPPGRKSGGAGVADPDSPEALSRLLAPYATRPEASASVVERNAIHAGNALGLDNLEQDLLVLVIRGNAGRRPMQTLFQLAWSGLEELPRFIAALLGVEQDEVQSRLEKSARLQACGLITVDAEAAFSDFGSAESPLPRVARQMRKPFATAEAWVQGLLGARVKTLLRWADFAHVRIRGHGRATAAPRCA